MTAKSTWIEIVDDGALNLLVRVALAFISPRLTVSPGLLVKGHADLATDCPADHNKFFVLDRDHDTSCETGHKNKDHSRNT